MSYLLIVVVIVFFRPGSGMEITTCDCEKPVFVGLIDSSEPNYCRDTLEEDSQDVIYEVIEQVEPPLSNVGYLCRQWLRQKKITGFFLGGYDTVFTETPYEATPQDCWQMAYTKKCGGNPMKVVGRAASFTREPEGEGVWMDIVVKTLFNCELEEFNVTQDCFNCPIRSPFGALTESTTNEKRSTRKGHLTYVWNKPIAHPDHCTYKIVRKGLGTLLGMYNSSARSLRDDRNQLEYIISGTPEKICSFENCYKSEGLPNTFVRFTKSDNSERPTTTVAPVSTTTLAGELTPSQVRKYFVVNNETGHCLGTFGRPAINSSLRAEDCGTSRSEYFMHVSDKIVSMSMPSLCVALDKGSNNTKVIFRKCVKGKSKIEDWTFDEKIGTVSIGSSCLSLVTSQAQMTTSIQNRPYGVVVLPCGGSNAITHQHWKFVEVKDERPITMADDGSLISEVSHRQYVEGKFVEMANTINDEIKSVYCEAYKVKQFVALAVAQNSPMLAGIALGLPVCQRVLATGRMLVVQQCKTELVKVEAEKTKCGFEPKWGKYTVGKDGFTRVNFQPCFWGGFVNLNGETYEYVNGTWTNIQPNVRISAVGLTTHFHETVENEAQYLQNLETSFHANEIDQINVIGELMALMQHESINSISPIIMHTQSESQFGSFSDWVFGLKMAGIVVIVLFLVVFSMRCCPTFKCCIREKLKVKTVTRPLPHENVSMAPLPPPPSPTTAIAPSPLHNAGRSAHSHTAPRLSITRGYIWEDGCPLIQPRPALVAITNVTDMDDSEV